MKMSFDPKDIHHGFNLVKLVKPMIGDYILHINGHTLSIISYDRRRYCRADIKATSYDVDDNFESDDFFLSCDRQALFESKLSSLTLSINDKGLNIKAEDEGQKRQANIRRRPDNSRRPKVNLTPLPDGGIKIKPRQFEKLLRQVSCSALVKETKTEVDMKMNQVHFYSSNNCVISNARTYASAAFMSDLSLDLSIVSSDIPLCRSFCSKINCDDVIIGQSKSHLFLSEPTTGSYILMSRVECNKPPIFLVSDNEYSIEIEVDKEKFSSNLNWSHTAIEGTSRLSIHAIKSSDSESGYLNMNAGSQEIASMPVLFRKGKELSADFHVSIMTNIISYIDSEKVLLRYSHPKIPTLLEISSPDSDEVSSRHFIQSMRSH